VPGHERADEGRNGGRGEPVRTDRGVNAIALVVDRLSDEVVKNPKLNVNPPLREWNESGKLHGLKFMRTLWLCEQAGGLFQLHLKDMHEAHKDRSSTFAGCVSARLSARVAGCSVMSEKLRRWTLLVTTTFSSAASSVVCADSRSQGRPITMLLLKANGRPIVSTL
jgi:hypothetical protein